MFDLKGREIKIKFRHFFKEKKQKFMYLSRQIKFVSSKIQFILIIKKCEKPEPIWLNNSYFI